MKNGRENRILPDCCLRNLSDIRSAQQKITEDPYSMKKSAKGRLFRITKKKVLINGREGTQGREQFVLDLPRKEVVDGIYEQISAVIRSADISYVKWDMNRQLTDVGNTVLAPERQGDICHRSVKMAFMTAG